MKFISKNVNFIYQKKLTVINDVDIDNIIISHIYATAKKAFKFFTAYMNHPGIK